MAKCPECNSKVRNRDILLRLWNRPFICISCGTCLRVKSEDMMILIVLLNAPAVLIVMLYPLSNYEPGILVLLAIWLMVWMALYVRFAKIAKEDLDKCAGQKSNNRR